MNRCKILILGLSFLGLLSPADAQHPINVVSTIGQITNVVEVIGGDRVDVEGLMGPGVDPHLYKASESDVRKLSEAQMIFYNGLNLEAKIGDILQKMSRNVKTVALGENIDKTQLLDSINYPGHFDPHIWFDCLLWMEVSKGITDELIAFDPSHKDEYYARWELYREKLEDLHKYVQSRASELPAERRILVTAHDAFRYFGRTYGFEVVGLQGISTESEAGTKDVMELADFITGKKVKAVFIESSVPERNIKAVQEAVRARGWDVKIGGELFSDAMGTEGTFEGTYIGMVTHNIDTIVNALK